MGPCLRCPIHHCPDQKLGLPSLLVPATISEEAEAGLLAQWSSNFFLCPPGPSPGRSLALRGDMWPPPSPTSHLSSSTECRALSWLASDHRNDLGAGKGCGPYKHVTKGKQRFRINEQPSEEGARTRSPHSTSRAWSLVWSELPFSCKFLLFTVTPGLWGSAPSSPVSCRCPLRSQLHSTPKHLGVQVVPRKVRIGGAPSILPPSDGGDCGTGGLTLGPSGRT